MCGSGSAAGREGEERGEKGEIGGWDDRRD